MKKAVLQGFVIILSLLKESKGFRSVVPDYEHDYTVYSEMEKIALERFRDVVLEKIKPTLPQNMLTDMYLIRWLRAKDLNIKEAQQMLTANLNWRKANRMDTVLSEDWTDMQEDYPFDNDTFDKKGRPIGTVNLGSWNILAAAIAGRMPRLTRYMASLLESSATNVMMLQDKGVNVTQFKILLNLDGFNGIQHTCPVCLPAYTTFVNAIQNYYPGYAHKVILINTPIVFKTVLDIIQPLFTARTRRILRIFGTDKKEWMTYLNKSISVHQRHPEFGGVKAYQW